MKIDFEIFTSSLEHTLREILGAEISPGIIEPYEVVVIDSGFASIIGIIDVDGGRGNIILNSTPKSAVEIAIKLGMDPSANDPAYVMDTMGEILNIVVGTAQRKCRHRFQFSTPVSVHGGNPTLKIFNKNMRFRFSAIYDGEPLELFVTDEGSPGIKPHAPITI